MTLPDYKVLHPSWLYWTTGRNNFSSLAVHALLL